MKIEIRLIDEKEASVKGAILRIHLVNKDGTSQMLAPMKSNVRGEVPPSSMSPDSVKLLNFAKSKYQIEQGGKYTPWMQLKRPNSVGKELLKWTLIAKNLGKGKKEEPSLRTTGQILQINLQDIKGNPLKNVSARLELKTVKGKRLEAKVSKSNSKGFAQFNIAHAAKSVDWASADITATVAKREYKLETLQGPENTAEGLIAIANLAPVEVKPTPPAPPTPSPDIGDSKAKILRLTVEDEKRNRLKKVPITLTLKTLEGESLEQQVVTSNNSGQVDFELKLPPSKIDWPSSTISASSEQFNYTLSDIGGFKETKQGWVANVILKVVGEPPTPPKPGKIDWTNGAESGSHAVHGIITGNGGKPSTNITIAVNISELGKGTEELGKVRTGKNGRYRFYYTPRKGRRAENLLIKASRGSNLVAMSGLIPQAGVNEKVDFSIGSEAFNGMTYYSELREAVEDVFGEGTSRKLEVQDVAQLANKTNHNAIALAHYVRAWDLVEDTERFGAETVLAEPFFALTSGGTKPLLSAVLSLSNERIKTLLSEAHDANWIARQDIQTVLDALSQLRHVYFESANTDLSMLMNAAGIADKKKGQVTAIVLDESKGKDKWQHVSSAVGASKANKLKNLVEMWRVLEKDATLTVFLSTQKNVSNIRELVAIDKATLKDSVSQGNEMPDTIQGKNVNEKRTNYTTALLRLIEARNAHLHFLVNLSRSSLNSIKSVASTFLARTELNLEDVSTLRKLPTREVDEDLADLATLFLICPKQGRAKSAEILMRIDHFSSMSIDALPKQRFMNEVRGKLTPGDAEYIYNRAIHLGSVTKALSVEGLESNPRRQTTLLGQLFSDAINDDCSHCMSTFGPGSYLLDLYKFLGKATFGNQSGVELLRSRRPDIEGIELSCKNADTLMPYIDLSLEVLEAKLVNDLGGDVAQTTHDAKQLRAEPELVRLQAYTELEQASFPWSLPISRDLERSKAYLEHLGLNLSGLHNINAPITATIATINKAFTAEFGVSNPEKIELGTGPQWLRNWGVSNRNRLVTYPSSQQERNISELANWLHIEPAVLVGLINSEFVSGTGVEISSNGTLTWSDFTNPVLMRLQFLGRLHLQTNLAIADLDRFLKLPFVDHARPISWRAELVALNQISQKLLQEVHETLRLLELPQNQRLIELAEILGMSHSTMNNLLTLSGIPLSTGSDIKSLLEVIESCDRQGFSVEQVVELLMAPESASLFSLKSNAALLETLFNTVLQRRSLSQDNVLESGTESSSSQVPIAKLEVRQFIEICADKLSVSTASVEAALSTHPDLVASIEALTSLLNTDALVLALARFAKVAFISEVFGLEKADLITLRSMTGEFNWVDIEQLPIESEDPVIDLNNFLDLSDHLRINAIHFRPFDQSLLKNLSSASSNIASVTSALSGTGVWSSNNIQFLLGSSAFNASNKSDFIAKRRFSMLSKFLDNIGSTKATAQELWQASVELNSDVAQNILSATVPENEYYDVLTQLNDPLRERYQDSFVSLLLSKSRDQGAKLGNNSKQELYEELLIDPQMGACFETSRVKQATASVQMLIQRIMLNLEGEGGFSETDKKQWAWRKNYRVWEANRKVFINPENWIEPELRDNKTELFKALETELMQGEVDQERVEKSLINYSKKLLSLSRMEMVASLHDRNSNQQHVFARTSDHPRQYYWCTRSEGGLWGGWVHIDLEIDGNHVLPVIFANRMFLFWASFTEKVDTDHGGYKDSLATIEVSEDIARSDINELSRRISDLEELIEKYTSYDSSDYGGIIGNLWGNLATAMRTLKSTAEREYETAKEDLASLKSQKDWLSTRYTYFEVALNWTQYDKLSGWSPTKRSTESVTTVYEDKEGEDVHRRGETSFWLFANPGEETLDIELRTGGGNANGNPHDYRIGIFEFDPVLEFIKTLNERRAPWLQRKAYFSTLLTYGQSLRAVHPLPSMKIDVDNQDQTLLTWDPMVGAKAFPEKIDGFNPSESPFLFSSANRSYLFEPIKPERGMALVASSEIPRVGRGEMQLLNQVTPISNFQNMNRVGSKRVSTDQRTATSAGIRRSALPLGQSTLRLADGRNVSELAHNPRPVTSEDWSSIRSVIVPQPSARDVVAGPLVNGQQWSVNIFYHPFADLILEELYRSGLDGIYRPDKDSGGQSAIRLSRQSYQRSVFDDAHSPTEFTRLEDDNEERFNFNRRQPFSIYNWELFFHAPFAIAKHLTRNNKFEEAQNWLHYIFDPVSKDQATNKACWRFRPFFLEHEKLLDGSSDELTEAAEQNFAQFEAQVTEWERNPFNPHAVARLRTISYMRATYIAYIDNLLSWADMLYRRDSMESVAEAAQLYIQASQLLGPAPIDLPQKGLKTSGVSLFAMATGKVEVHPIEVASGVDIPPAKPEPNDFYTKMGDFCIPTNDKIKEYWTTIADRLFKIRHCMNIEGVERALALYQPPIDPAMLVRAAAAGVDIGAAIASVNASRPHYRFASILQKAKEFTGEVKALGGALLSALEKKDSEELSQIRSNHEVAMQKRVLEIKKERLKEAEESHKSLERSLFSAMDRRDHYQRLLDQGQLPQEVEEVKKLDDAGRLSTVSDTITATSAILSAIPQIGFNGFMPKVDIGGVNFGSAAAAVGQVSSIRAGGLNRVASMLGRDAGIIRRNKEWEFQLKQATREIERIEKDQIASEIRLAISEKEIADQEVQIQNTNEAYLFLKDKFTNAELYGWMVSQLSGLHYQAYQLALDMARQAEACMKFELDRAETTFIGFGYWDSLKKGLLAGERLSHDLNRLDAYYLANNPRKHELTKQVSLQRIDPMALIELKRNASCNFSLKEYLFNLDFPTHHKRRIKSVSVTIPAISGPYTSISCTLSVVASRANYGNDQPAYSMKTEKISISNAQGGTGLFQFDFRDERYLPFEGQFVDSDWTLQLPAKAIAQFDYGTISDVIMTVNYTAEENTAANSDQTDLLSGAGFNAEEQEFDHLLSMQSTFPDLWSLMVSAESSDQLGDFGLSINPSFFPYLIAGRQITVTSMAFFTESSSGVISDTASAMMEDLNEQLVADHQISMPNSVKDVLVTAGDVNKAIYVKVTYRVAEYTN